MFTAAIRRFRARQQVILMLRAVCGFTTAKSPTLFWSRSQQWPGVCAGQAEDLQAGIPYRVPRDEDPMSGLVKCWPPLTDVQ